MSSEYPGTKGIWEGFTEYTFELCGKNCRIIVPGKELEGRPWIWRARFFGVAANADQTLLQKGYHIAHIDISNLFGSPAAVKLWDEFYKMLTEKLGFNHKVAMEGMSRGGLIVYNWSKKNADKVSCIYCDAPVCNFKSWPGLYREELYELRDTCLKAYGFTIEDAEKFRDNPIDNLEPLAQNNIPILHVCGECDESVPTEENTYILMQRYKKLGGNIELILKKGAGHHPHGLDDPTPIVDFIIENYKYEK